MSGRHLYRYPTRCDLGGTTLLASHGWDALSRRTTLTCGNATTATYAYRSNDDLASIKHQLKQSAVTFNHTYNGAGQSGVSRGRL